jgi:hypothetical protein
VDRLLASDVDDLRVVLVGPWDSLTGERRDILADPLLQLRLVAANYRSEPRVHLATTAPATVFPSPYRLDLPSSAGVGPSTVGELVAAADTAQAGLVRAGELTLWRTAAVSRAARALAPGESLVDAVTAVHGQYTMDSPDVADLNRVELTSPSARRYDRDVVVVGGVRRLARAARLVVRKSLRRSS